MSAAEAASDLVGEHAAGVLADVHNDPDHIACCQLDQVVHRVPREPANARAVCASIVSWTWLHKAYSQVHAFVILEVHEGCMHASFMLGLFSRLLLSSHF